MDDVFGEDDEFDDLLVSVLENSTGVLPATSHGHHTGVQCGTAGLVDGFDVDAGRTWIYPTTKEYREYQFNIVRKALLTNTLVCLPTGLGKTFIAAVIMYNYYRWFPRSKILFMAPTKPLVAQQIEACFEVMGIPQEHMSEMTGSMPPNDRREAWKEKRIFFLTPQIISNDISRGICPARQVKCVVVDEAHKALGNHSYVQVVRELHRQNTQFRVLALSATPGSDSRQVQQVINNLLIAHVEIRTDDSCEIAPYTHMRYVEKVVVPLGDELSEMKTQFLEIVRVYVNRLSGHRVLCMSNLELVSKFMLLKERDRFRQNPPSDLPRSQFGVVEGDFAISISLYHAFDLLLFYGAKSFYVYWQELLNGDKGSPRMRFELQRNVTFCRLMQQLSRRFGDSPSATQQFAYSHPKFEKLEEIVLRHFETARQESPESFSGTRVIVFAQYRESVREIEDALNRHRPHVRPALLLGHSRNNSKGLNQKLQLEVMNNFRSGTCNVLVSTCVGEEGLDVGDVDLIVCFDAQKSPIRLVQRMGRTGRKRTGRVVVLVTKGKEEKIHNQGQYNNRAVNRAAETSARNYDLFQNNPRIIPAGVESVCHKMYLTAKKFVHANDRKCPSSSRTAVVARDRKSASPYLSEEKLSEWLLRYRVDPKEVRDLDRSRSRMLALEDAAAGTSFGRPSSQRRPEVLGGRLSLSEWIPWQNTLNPTFVAGHSERSQLFVDTMKRLGTAANVEEPVSAPYVEAKLVGLDQLRRKKRKSSSSKCDAQKKKPKIARGSTSKRSVGTSAPAATSVPATSVGCHQAVPLTSNEDMEDFSLVFDRNKTPVPEEQKQEEEEEDLSSFFAFALMKTDGSGSVRRRLSVCGRRRMFIVPPPLPIPPRATSGADWLDSIVSAEVDPVATSSSAAAVVFRTPLSVTSSRKLCSSLEDTQEQLRLFAAVGGTSSAPPRPAHLEESLYSMSQLIEMLDAESVIEVPPTPLPTKSVRNDEVLSRKDSSKGGDVDPFDSDDDLFATDDIVPPSPPPPTETSTTTTGSLVLHPVARFSSECKTSTPLGGKDERSPGPSDDDDDFTRIVKRRGPHRHRNRLRFESQAVPGRSRRRQSPILADAGRCFLLEEAAAVTTADASSISADESVEEIDSHDENFIDDDDAIRPTQEAEADTSVAMYLRSVKSPTSRPGAFILGKARNDRDVDVYSQTPPTSDSDYMEDSFCVANDTMDTSTSSRKSSSSLVKADTTSDDERQVQQSKSSSPVVLPLSPVRRPPTPVKVSASRRDRATSVQVLVDSREISGSQDVISELRLKHSARVQVASLGSCDYIVSKRLAVERKFASDVANGALRRKLLDRLCVAMENFERVCLIVERDRVRPKEQPRKVVVTTYLANTLACLVQTPIRIIWTKSQAHTAEVIVDLALHETRSNFALRLPPELESGAPPAFAFYRRLLPCNYVAAWNLCEKFPSVSSFLQSSVEEIRSGGLVPQARAESVYENLHRKFP